jgi:hypothetical protein
VKWELRRELYQYLSRGSYLAIKTKEKNDTYLEMFCVCVLFASFLVGRKRRTPFLLHSIIIEALFDFPSLGLQIRPFSLPSETRKFFPARSSSI